MKIDEEKAIEAVEAVEGFGRKHISGEFPFQIFPPQLGSLIKKLAEAYSVNPEPIACAMLTILSAAIGNTVRISPKPSWLEPPFIWHAMMGETGSGKTPFVSRLLEPIHLLQSKQVGVSVGHTELSKLKHYFTTDITVEALAEILGVTPRGILAHHDELAGFIKGHDQYKSKGNDRQKYLELWNCDPWKKDRLLSGSFYIRNTGCSILGGIQPRIMPDIFKTDAFCDGLLPRFTFSIIEPKPYSKDSVGEGELRFWHELVTSCYQIPLRIGPTSYIDYRLLCFSEEAHNDFALFHTRYDFLSEWPDLGIFIPKLRAYAIRIAGVLLVMRRDESSIIDEAILYDSIQVIDYFVRQVIRVLSLYSKKAIFISEINQRLLNTLKRLYPQVEKGRLSLMAIQEELNRNAREGERLDSQAIAYELLHLGLKTKLVTGYSHLVWETAKIEKLFLQC